MASAEKTERMQIVMREAAELIMECRDTIISGECLLGDDGPIIESMDDKTRAEIAHMDDVIKRLKETVQ